MKKQKNLHETHSTALSAFPLDQEAVKRLDTILISMPSHSWSISKVDGFLCALCLFRLYRKINGISLICDKAVWDCSSEKAWVKASLTALFAYRKNQIRQFFNVDYMTQFMGKDIGFPKLFPLVDDQPLPIFSMEMLDETQKARLMEWCRGYLTALRLDEPLLLELKKKQQDELLDMIISIIALARPDKLHFSEFLVYLKDYEEWDKKKGEWTGDQDNLVKELTLSFASTSITILKNAYENLFQLEEMDSLYSIE